MKPWRIHFVPSAKSSPELPCRSPSARMKKIYVGVLDSSAYNGEKIKLFYAYDIPALPQSPFPLIQFKYQINYIFWPSQADLGQNAKVHL